MLCFFLEVGVVFFLRENQCVFGCLVNGGKGKEGAIGD